MTILSLQYIVRDFYKNVEVLKHAITETDLIYICETLNTSNAKKIKNHTHMYIFFSSTQDYSPG